MTLMENIKYEEYEANLLVGYCPTHVKNEYIEDQQAWRTATKGLIIHRPLVYRPEGEVFPTTCLSTLFKVYEGDALWTVTHRRTGAPLLRLEETFTRQKEAFKFAKRMGKFANWTYAGMDSYDYNEEIYQGIIAARASVMREMESELAGIVVYDEDFDPPFIINVERTEGGRLFHVMNKVDGITAATFPHRGLAVEKAVELNLEAMV